MFEKELLTNTRYGGQKARVVRVRWAITTDKLARKVGVLETVVHAWEKGRKLPQSTVDALKKALAEMVFERALELTVILAPPGDPRVAALRLNGKRKHPAGHWNVRHPRVTVIDDESPST